MEIKAFFVEQNISINSVNSCITQKLLQMLKTLAEKRFEEKGKKLSTNLIKTLA